MKYFMHVHVLGDRRCLWYMEDKRGGGLSFSACDAAEGTEAQCLARAAMLQVYGVPVASVQLIGCDSKALLTHEMRKVLNLA